MTCPKCKAKVGIVQEKISTMKGLATGKICYMCGHWIQENPDFCVTEYSSLACDHIQDFCMSM